jgi:hypothetical protein
MDSGLIRGTGRSIDSESADFPQDVSPGRMFQALQNACPFAADDSIAVLIKGPRRHVGLLIVRTRRRFQRVKYSDGQGVKLVRPPADHDVLLAQSDALSAQSDGDRPGGACCRGGQQPAANP